MLVVTRSNLVIVPRVRQLRFNPFWNRITYFVYENFRLKKYFQVFSSFFKVWYACCVLACIIIEYNQSMHNFNVAIFIAATCFGHPNLTIIRLCTRNEKRILFTYNLLTVFYIQVKLSTLHNLVL